MAIGNVDNDVEGDTWGITSSPIATDVTLQDPCGVDTTTTLGSNVSAGEPTNAFNDVSCGG
ncbi:MAG: hypothetical protein EOO71_31975 [Myxococcaceae bacterium]|nr:MAG: hypothetical protein EOO71_31975 [Myxococcaceae bacterium]